MKNPLFSISIKSRLILYFLFIMCVPSFIIFGVLYNRSHNLIYSRVSASIHTSLNVIQANFTQKFDEINHSLTSIYFAPGFLDILSSPRSYDSVALRQEMWTLDEALSYNANSVTGLSGVQKLYMYDRPEYAFFTFSDKVMDLGAIENEAWYKSIPARGDYSVVGTEGAVIRVAKRLYGLNNRDIPFAALITDDVGVDGLTAILANYKPSPQSIAVVFDKDNNVILCSQDITSLQYDTGWLSAVHQLAAVESRIVPCVVTQEKYLLSSVNLPGLGWRIATFSPEAEMYGELNHFNQITALIVISCLLLAVVMALFFSENISYPIRVLSRSMSVVKEGVFDISVTYRRNDEFSVLIAAYQTMLKEIQDLINKLYISEIRKKDAEFMALQAQINPHFLYNTLDSVNWLAIAHDAPEISQMVTSISDFFRYNLSKAQNHIPIADERKQVERYLTIQKFRFGNKLNYGIDFPRETLQFLTIKFILQPLVENAIIHGVEKLEGDGFISITARKDDTDIEFIVSDNGPETNAVHINALLDDTIAAGRSYGIQNVHNRIKQTFGEAYGVRYECNSPRGVKAVVRIKAIRSVEEFHG